MTAGRKIRTLIVDDEPLARRKIRRMLARDPEVEIPTTARTGERPSRRSAIALPISFF
jgi:chemotaxis response regulator CheB